TCLFRSGWATQRFRQGFALALSPDRHRRLHRIVLGNLEELSTLLAIEAADAVRGPARQAGLQRKMSPRGAGIERMAARGLFAAPIARCAGFLRDDNHQCRCVLRPLPIILGENIDKSLPACIAAP